MESLQQHWGSSWSTAAVAMMVIVVDGVYTHSWPHAWHQLVVIVQKKEILDNSYSQAYGGPNAQLVSGAGNVYLVVLLMGLLLWPRTTR
jgi:hypothetical protein